MTPFVVVGCPARNRAWIIGEHVASLTLQRRLPDALFYLMNDCEDATDEALAHTALLDLRPPTTIEVFNTGHPGWHRGTPESGWKGGPHRRYHEDQCANLALLRNRWIDRALKLWPQATHFWSVDSDVLPAPDCLELLLAAEKDVVAAVVRNGERAWNFMSASIHGEPRRTALDKRGPELHAPAEVALLGACVLIRREVLEYDRDYLMVRFAPHPRGEDFPFCAAAREAGYQLWIEPRARTEHWMSETGVWR